jgi:hypothetical protein
VARRSAQRLAAAAVEQVQMARVHVQRERRCPAACWKRRQRAGDHLGIAQAHGDQRLGAQRLEQLQRGRQGSRSSSVVAASAKVLRSSAARR